MGNNAKLKARTILDNADDSAKSFLDAFDIVRKAREAKKGKPTHEEQDLLRAGLVFAGAGLDSMLKQLIRETIKQLAAQDPNVKGELELFVQRRIRGDSEDVGTISGHKFLASILVAPPQEDRIIEEYIRELTGSSLQSADQVLKASKALGLDSSALGLDKANLTRTFGVRNKIIHELDVNLETSPGKSSRQSRTKAELKAHIENLLDTGKKMLEAVETRLQSSV